MRPLFFRLKGSIGIKTGMGLDEISIVFSQFQPGIIAIQGDNGTGKSTILKNCHPYLMATGSKKKIQEHFMLRDSEKEFICIQDGIKYRTHVLIDAKSEKAEAYIYEYLADGTQKPLNNGLLGSYTEQVEKIFGSAEIFENVLNSSRKLTPITQMKSMDRKKIFYHFLGSKLTIFEEYDKIAKKRYDDAISLMEKTRNRISFIEESLAKLPTIENITINQSELETRKADCIKKVDELKKKIQAIDEQLVSENHKLSLVDETEAKIKQLEENKHTYTKNLATATINYNSNSSTLDNKKSELESEISRKEKILQNEDKIKNALYEMETLRELLNITIPKVKTRKAEIEKEISQLNLSYQELKSKYDSMVSEITNRYDKQASELEKEFTARQSAYQLQLSETKRIKDGIESKYQKLIDQEEKQYSDAVNEYTKQQQEARKLEWDREAIEKEIANAEIIFERDKNRLIKDMERAQRNSGLIDRVACTQLMKGTTNLEIQSIGKQCSDNCELLQDARLNRDMIGAIASNQIKLQNEFDAQINEIKKRLEIKESDIAELKAQLIEPDRSIADQAIIALANQRNNELSEILEPEEPDDKIHISAVNILRLKKEGELFVLHEPIKPDTLAQDMELSRLKEIILKETQQRMKLEALERQGWEGIQKEFDEAKLILPEKRKALSEILNQITSLDERYTKEKNEIEFNVSAITLQIEQLKKQADRKQIQSTIDSRTASKLSTQTSLGLEENNSLPDYNNQLLELNSKLNKIQELTSEKSKEGTELSTFERKVERLTFIREGLSKNGIPALIIHNVGLDVASISNEFLRSGETGIRINFDTLRPTKSGDYKESFEIGIYRGEDEIDVGDLSDGETVFVDESISKAMSEYLTDPLRYSSHKYDSEFIDEQDGALSAENKPIYIKLLEESRRRSNRYYSFMVTHTPEVWKTIAQRIHLSKEHGIEIVN